MSHSLLHCSSLTTEAYSIIKYQVCNIKDDTCLILEKRKIIAFPTVPNGKQYLQYKGEKWLSGRALYLEYKGQELDSLGALCCALYPLLSTGSDQKDSKTPQ